MESWVSTLFKDIKGKVGFSGQSSSPTTTFILSSSPLYEYPPRTDSSWDYFPSGLSASDLRLFAQYILKMRNTSMSQNLVNVLGKLLFLEDLASESIAKEPCLELDMSKLGHACIAMPLRERSWPPQAGYSFVCWFKYWNLNSHPEGMGLTLFSVSSAHNEFEYSEELCLKENGVLILKINGTYSLSSPSLELEEGQWYHLAVILSPRNALVAEHPSHTVYIYVDGNLRHNGELACAPLLVEKDLLMTVGMPAIYARVSNLKWALRSFYLFQEQLSPDCIHLMYIIGRGYKDLFQGAGVLYHSTNEAEGGDRFPVLDSGSSFGTERSATADEVAISESDGAKTDWSMEMLENVWLELCGKKLIYAFNATRTEALPDSQSLKLLNLVDPILFASFPTDLPCSGHLCGDISVCRRCVTGNIIHRPSGIAAVLALVEAAETTDMLYMALTLLASVLHQNSQRAKQMKACRGFQLLSSFLRTKITLVDTQCLHILFNIAVHESSFMTDAQNSLVSPKSMSQVSSPVLDTAKILDELYIAEYQESIDASSANEGTFIHYSAPSNANNTAIAPAITGALSDGDIVEHLLLDWTIWVTASVSIQLEILNFFETLVSVYRYKAHNLAVLRERNIVQHLLIALHTEDIEVLVIEKFVLLLTVILEDKFVDCEVKSVTLFMLATLDPPEVTKPLHVLREMACKRVTLRNILLEALIDLQVTITSEELLEKWHTILSSKLVAHFLDEAVHPSTIGWIINLLGLCLTSSSSTFTLEFQRNGGYQTLVRVLPKFHDLLDIYYTIFCLIFSKPIYPKLPEVGILDFEILVPSQGDNGSLKFSNLLDSIVAMNKYMFDQLSLMSIPSDQNANISQAVTTQFVEGNTDVIEEVAGEASLHSKHVASLLGWNSAANATSILRHMANLAKMWPSFSGICSRTEFLESCVELYFSIVRTYLAVKATTEHDAAETVIESSFLGSEGDDFWYTESSSPRSSDEKTPFMTSSRLLLEIDNSGYTGDPGSAGATAVIDLIAEALSYSLIQQPNSVPVLQSILESVPLNFDSETVLTFKALCLDRIMNYLERRLQHNDERGGPMLDNSNLWSNLASFCSLVVDCVYIGVFSRASNVMRVLEFCLSVLHLAKDSQIEEAALPWTGLLSIWRGSQPIDVILKSTNRMVLYCFLPSFLATIGEDALLSSAGFTSEDLKVQSSSSAREETRFDICIVLELLHAHKEIVFHSGNLDPDMYCSLCINLISLFPDPRKDARNAAIGIMKYLLTQCRAAIEDVLISKPNQEQHLDVLNGAFEKLLTENASTFIEWFQTSEHEIKQVLQQFAGVRWSQYITESAKFPVERLASLEDQRTLRMGKSVEDAAKLEVIYRDQCITRRSTLEAARTAVLSEFEQAHQTKCESGLRAEDEWRAYLQQLGHEHKLERVSTMSWEDYWPLC